MDERGRVIGDRIGVVFDWVRFGLVFSQTGWVLPKGSLTF